ncbi:hypothetical protein V6N12_054245 [Hibiscus sabdariffa]|uniref:Uncharacterized protein n=1 Tax=Hibiscus sabdariffa TaxID=183260 RepID=A0ABR2CZU3_9ROSI
MASVNEFEDGLKMIEELTTIAEQVQEHVLGQILSGTTGGELKIVPVTSEISNLRTVYVSLLTSVMKKHFGNMDQAGKRLDFMFAILEIETPSGIKARIVTTSMYKDNDYRNIISKHYTSPIETIFCSDTKQSMYRQLLIGLIRRDEVVMFASNFLTAILRVIKFFEDF